MTSDENRATLAVPGPRAPASAGNPGSELRRYIPLAVWMVVLLTLLLIPGKIISYGYIPHDDALRHAAKAESGKPWPEILVMRDDFGIDPHPGWHAVLGAVHKLFACNAEKLVVISVVGLMLLVSAAALPWLRWPECWLAAMLAATICVPRLSARLALGRPYLFTVAACLALIYIWSRVEQRKPRPFELIFTIVVVAVDAWIHGGWYQMGLPIAALILAGRWRPALWYGLCFLAGSVLGCAFTGHPWQFLFQSTRHLLGVFGDFHVDRELSAELLPSGGDPLMVLAVIAMLFWRARSPDWSARELLNPIFMMGIMGWVLGLKMYRFWDDWGLTSLMLWLALELQKQLERSLSFESGRRLMIAAGLGLSLFLASTSDINSRYTWNLTNEYLEEQNPELTGWLPQKGGILYSAEMSVFFETFYKNPMAPWRYILGFESALMKPEDLQVYRKIQWNFGDVRAYEPWVKKMRPEDRLVIRASRLHSAGPPNIPELEWKYAVTDLWVGRLPGEKK
jgi:hypothetical protein